MKSQKWFRRAKFKEFREQLHAFYKDKEVLRSMLYLFRLGRNDTLV